MKKLFCLIPLLALTLLPLRPALLAAAPAGPAYVRIQVLHAGATIREGFTQNTSLEALQRVVLYPRVTGRLERLTVAKGAVVKKGQQIAVLAHAEQDAQIAAARAAVARTRAECANAQIELQRYRRLKKEGFSTQQLLDSKDTAYRSARAQYDVARSDLDRLTVTRDEYIITASIDGTVLNDYALAPGAMLSPNTPVAELADLSVIKATFRVPEKRFYSIHPGMSVLLSLDALPAEEFRAQIVAVDDYIDPQSRTASVEAQLENAAAGNKLRPGMFGRAFVVEREASDAFVVPISALRFDRVADSENNELVLHDHGTAKVVKVKTGISQGVNVQILAGLKDGDEVIVFGGNALKDGDPVRLMQ